MFSLRPASIVRAHRPSPPRSLPPAHTTAQSCKSRRAVFLLERPRPPVLARMHKRRRHLLHLLVVKILTRDKPSILHSRIQRVRRDVSILISRLHRPPIMKIQRTIPAPARRRRRTAVLLRSVHPVRKTMVRNHVIKLSGRLVVPRTPRLAAVACHQRALIAAQSHSPRLVRIDPQCVVIVTARRSTKRRKRFPAIA